MLLDDKSKGFLLKKFYDLMPIKTILVIIRIF